MCGSGCWVSVPRCTRITAPGTSNGLPSAQMRPMPPIGPSAMATAKLAEVAVFGHLDAAAAAATLAAAALVRGLTSSRKSVAQMMLPPVRMRP